MSDKLNVCELFHNIQGEGKYVGLNVAFLRLSGCTLRCSFCDTNYHWKSVQKTLLSVSQDILDYKTMNLVVTGGEPLFQQDQLIKLLEILPEDLFVTIETNGTIVPKKELISLVDHWSCSPKLASSGNDIDKRMNYDALKKLNVMNDVIFKFVVTSDKDLKEIKFLQDQINIDSNKIYLMAEGATSRKQYVWMEKVIELAKTNGYNFSPRLHVMIWDIKRAV